MKHDRLHPSRSKALPHDLSTTPPHSDPLHTAFLKEYGRIELRPIRPADEARMIGFHKGLSEESIYLRYFEHISLDTRTLHERLAVVCTNTTKSFAIVAERHPTCHHSGGILGVGRLTTTDMPYVASFAILISDECQKTELPRELLKHLVGIARAHDFAYLEGELLVADHDTLNLCRDLGFTLQTVPEEGIVRVRYSL